MATDMLCSDNMVSFRNPILLKIWIAFLQPFPIKFQHTKRVANGNLLFGKLRAFSPLLSSSKCAVVVKGTVLQFAVRVSK